MAASAEMAGRWEMFMEDGDRYNLQYRTQKDGKVRPEHAALDGVTLPPTDQFWEEFLPPNGWNCRCTVTQVRKSKYPETPHDEAMQRGEEALQKDTKGMFRFNPGKEGKTVPDYNPYTIRRCRDCDIAKGKLNLARITPPYNQLCSACNLLHQCQEAYTFTPDTEFGKRLLISKTADQSELIDNIRAAKTLLNTFKKMEMHIRGDIVVDGGKNPEYLINGLIADRKGIESVNGVSAGFGKAIKQGCSTVVLDLDMQPKKFAYLNANALANKIANRYRDFISGPIKECYVIFDNQAIMIDNSYFIQDPDLPLKQHKAHSVPAIESVLKKIRNNRSHS